VLDLILYLVEHESGWLVIVGALGFLILEFALDIVKDLFMDWLRGRKSNE